MKTPNETHEKRTPRPQHWLRAIEFRKNHLAREYRETLGDKARDGISDEDYATAMATLEKMARNLGWDETFAHKHGWPGHGFGRFGRGYGHPAMMHGFGPRRFHGHADHADEHDHNHERETDTPTNGQPGA